MILLADGVPFFWNALRDSGACTLPDLKSLEMQWVLQGVAAMSTASKPHHGFSDDGDDLPVALQKSSNFVHGG